MMKYYNDERIIEEVEEVIEALKGVCVTSEEIEQIEIMNACVERINQKNTQIKFLQERLNEAASIIGHNVISEAMYE